jgi:threonine dehydrogenase-like Zn-dependent dehydrogenase
MQNRRKHRFLLLQSPYIISLLDSDPPAAFESEQYVRLNVRHCGICGTDLAFYRGRKGASYPRTLGHEYWGILTAVGEQVSGWKVGDRVAVDLNYRCGTCFYCRTGASHLCDESGANLFTGRGFADSVDLHSSYLRAIPQFDPAYLGSLLEPLSCALHALELAQVRSDDDILLLGCGSLGSMLCVAIHRLFPEVGLDVYDPNLHRSANLETVFSNQVSALKQPPLSPHYSLVLEAAGRITGFEFATRAVRKAGRVVVLSRYTEREPASLSEDLARKECALFFSHLNGDGATFLQAVELLASLPQPICRLLVDVQPLSNAVEVFEHIESSPFNKTILEI